jgi:hypothetical protein
MKLANTELKIGMPKLARGLVDIHTRWTEEERVEEVVVAVAAVAAVAAGKEGVDGSEHGIDEVVELVEAEVTMLGEVGQSPSFLSPLISNAASHICEPHSSPLRKWTWGEPTHSPHWVPFPSLTPG